MLASQDHATPDKSIPGPATSNPAEPLGFGDGRGISSEQGPDHFQQCCEELGFRKCPLNRVADDIFQYGYAAGHSNRAIYNIL